MIELYISVAKDFTATPGGRYARDGNWSGELFRDTLLEPKYQEAIAQEKQLVVALDGTAGYATSFLEEAFGGLVRKLKRPVSSKIMLISENSLRKREVTAYMTDEEKKLA